jgi:hypothetical protein
MQTKANNTHAVIDSGDVFIRAPSAVAQMINSAWNPAGSPMNDGTGRWTVPCNAAAPAIGLTMGNHVFNIDKADMLVEQNNVCWSSVADAENGPYVLGWPLLLNVVVSFNLNDRIMYWQEPAGHAIAPPSSSAVGSSALPSTTAAVATSSSMPSPTSPAVVPTPRQSSPIPITTGAGTTTIVGSSTSTTTVISLVIVTASPSA